MYMFGYKTTLHCVATICDVDCDKLSITTPDVKILGARGNVSQQLPLLVIRWRSLDIGNHDPLLADEESEREKAVSVTDNGHRDLGDTDDAVGRWHEDDEAGIVLRKIRDNILFLDDSCADSRVVIGLAALDLLVYLLTRTRRGSVVQTSCDKDD